jgi:calcium permeable stress-gated cation channel
MMIDDSYGPLIHSLPLTLAEDIGEEPAQVFKVPHESEESRDIVDNEQKAITSDSEAQNSTGISWSKRATARMASDDEPDIQHREQTDYGFAHPAASRPQQTIWMAKDILGLSAKEVKALQERGIVVSTMDAEMDAKGNVTIQGPPPDGESRA